MSATSAQIEKAYAALRKASTEINAANRVFRQTGEQQLASDFCYAGEMLDPVMERVWSALKRERKAKAASVKAKAGGVK